MKFLSIASLLTTIFFSLLLLPQVLAKGEKEFRPAAESIIIFPSEITSRTWKNIQTLNSQDLDEQALFQDFNLDNSAYIEFVENRYLPQEEPVPVDTTLEQADSNVNGVEGVDETQNSEDTNTDELIGKVSDERAQDVQESPGETPSEEQVPADTPAVPEEGGDAGPVTRATLKEMSVSGLSYVSVFTRVVGDFLFAQAETTSTTLLDDSEKPAVVTIDPEPQVSAEDLAPEVTYEAAPEFVEETVTEEETSDEDIVPVAPEMSPVEEVDIKAESTVPKKKVTEPGSYELILSDFGLPSLASGQFIDNLQLRLSLGGQADAPVFIAVDYKFGDFSRNAGSIIIESEASNALNGGYYLVPLPSVSDPALLADLSVSLTVTGDVSQLRSLYIDSAWLEVGTIVFDASLLKERFSTSEMLKHLEGLKHMDLLSDRLDFLRDELPKFNLRYNSQRNVLVRAFRSLIGRDLVEVESVSFMSNDGNPVRVSPEVTITSDGLVSIVMTNADRERLKPGLYSVEIALDEGGYISKDSFEFQWGLLSINSNQTEYSQNDIVDISMGALSPNGNTLCSANLNLYIIDPTGFISIPPVLASGQCVGNNVIDVPDYSAKFVADGPGEYTMHLERVDDTGTVISHTADTFFVRENQQFAIERSGPTRIYPPAYYPMQLTVHGVGSSFTGQLIERVPENFRIFNTNAEIRTQDSYTELVWNISVEAGADETVSYEFDAPDLSPYLYELGPAQLVGEGVPQPSAPAVSPEPSIVLPVSEEVPLEPEVTTPGIEEELPVEIAPAVPDVSEAPAFELTPKVMQEAEAAEKEVVPDPPAPIPEISLKEISAKGLSYVSVFTRAVGDFLFTQAETIDPAVTNSVEEITEATPSSLIAEPVIESATVLEAINATGSVAETPPANALFVEHRQWQIASDATGNMVLFWDNSSYIPTGWTCVSCAATSTFYQRFAVGSSTYNTTGGTATHTPSASGSVLASTLALTEPGTPSTVAIVSHTHTYTPTIGGGSNLPSYRQLRVIQYTSAAGEPPTIPNGAIGIFDVASSSLPTNWFRYGAQDGYFVRGEDTPGATGGSNTHTHTITGNTGNSVGTGQRVRGTPIQATAATQPHTHSVSSSTPTYSSEPPYTTVVFAQLNATSAPPLNLITMWTDAVPSGWVDVSSDPSSPLNNKFIKGATAYGTTAGSSTHAHADVNGIISTAPLEAGTSATTDPSPTGSDNAHTHTVNVTNFSTVSNLPPYLTVIFGKRYGTQPIFTQNSFRWYVNNNAQTPSDPWPSGATDLVEGEAVSATSTPLKYGDIVRLRINIGVSNATATASTTVKLQYASTTSTCSAISTWFDVGAATSSTVWRGYNTPVTDHETLSSTTLTASTKFETFEENGYAIALPNNIPPSGYGEWDFVLQQNGAYGGVDHCFRLVQSDGTAFSTYGSYPKLLTNYAPTAPTLSKLFDNEKVASTSPWFEFVSSDPESEDLNYEIQIDNDNDFSSPIADHDTTNNDTLFENLVVGANKDPFNSGQLIRYKTSATLSNGTTYWWRVRARDPGGSNTWGSWSSSRSFTIDTSLTASAWFQTTQAQFNTDTLVGTEAVASNQIQLITGSTTGTTTSSSMDFDNGSLGSAWGSLSWNDTETVGDIKYRIQYLSAPDTWTFIPDSVLTGNAAGFDTSPVSLLNLDTTTYNELRIVGVFVNAGGTPSLQDWTLSWGYRVATPSLTKLFSNEKTGTTTPTFVFVTTDPQGDSLTYQISWSTTTTFTASTTRTSDTHAGFANTLSGDTDPFNSGDPIQFKIQSGDALTNGTTYWWRVRAKDTTGDNVYSLWSSSQSFTVDTSVTVSTWFQTTKEQFITDTLSGTTGLTGGLLGVATTAVEAMLVYGEGIQSAPRYRLWDGSAWTNEGTMQDIGAPVKWATVKAGTTREEYVVATVGTDSDVNLQVYSLGAWGNLQEVTATMGNVNARGVDVAYETQSGDALIVYCDGDTTPSYYVWNGSTWTSGGGIGMTLTSNCEWIKLASDPTSDEIIVMVRDSVGTNADSYAARVWNGSAWSNTTTQGGARGTAYETMALEYEDSGGQALAVSGDGNPVRFEYNSWNGSAWAGLVTNSTITDNLMWAELVRDNGTDNMGMCYVNESVNIGVIRWTGSAWTGQTNLDTTGNAVSDRAISCSYETITGRDGNLMAVYSDDTNARYQSWSATSSAWSGESSVSTITDSATIQTRRTGDGNILAMFFDDANDRLDFSYWNGSSWSTAQTIESNASVDTSPYSEPFMMAPRKPNTTGSVIVSPGIAFTDGTGPYWSQMSWVDTTPGSSDILYSVQYYNAASSSWQFIPDSVIPGNAAGTTTSPIDLSGLSISTYSLIRPYAVLSCSGVNCPTVSDWTVKWADGITISGTLQQYDQTASTTSGTVAVAVNGVLQSGKTGAVSNGVWSISNVTVFPGDIVTVFVSGANEANEAVGVTRYDGTSNITGLTMYERHLSIGSDDATTTAITNTDIGLYDFSDSEDLFHSATGTALTVCVDSGCGDAELTVKAGTIYRPSGTLRTHDFENNGTIEAHGNTLYLSGSWDNNATATMATSTVVFTATSTAETIDGTGSINNTFYNLTFGTTTTSAVWSLVTTLDVDGNLSVATGTLARGSAAITIAGNLTTGANGYWTGVGTTTFDGSGTKNWADANVTLQNVGRVVVDGSSKIVQLTGNVRAQSIRIGADDALDASTSDYDITVMQDWVNLNTFVARGGEVFMSATTTGRIITANGNAFYDLTFNGVGGAWSFTESTLTVSRTLSIATGTVTMPTGTTTISGSFTNSGGTFAHNNALVYFTGSGSKTVTLGGTTFTNAFYDVRFGGSGTWSFTEANATTTNDFFITQGTVTLPSNTLTIGGSFLNTAGTFVHNNGTIRLTSTATETIDANASLYSLTFAGVNGSWSFVDSSVTALGNFTVLAGTTTLPSSTLTLGGSYTNSSTVLAGSGTVLFSSGDAGETINPGNSSLHNMTFSSSTGGWTIVAHATTTGNVTLTALSSFTLASGQTLAVGGTFTNSVGGASTTWTGSILSLEAGAYSLNAKTNTGDAYDTLRVKANTDIKMWNSSATTYSIDSTGSLYSQDHAGVDGDLYIFGSYERLSGSEYWSYGTDFDGAALTASTSRQVDVRFASGALALLQGTGFYVVGTTTGTTTIANQGSGTYTVTGNSGTTTWNYYDWSNLGITGVTLTGTGTVTSLDDGAIKPGINTGTGLTVASTTIDANPGLQIYRVDFSTTTAISATNVAQTDGTPASYWWFRDSIGNIQGEFFDNDTGDPGSVRWDDSSLVITVSGTVYSDDGATTMGSPVCDGSTEYIRVVVQGGASSTAPCAPGDGTYSVPGVVVVGDPVVTVYLDTNGGAKGVVVTRTPTADITDLDIYQNRVITRHEDTEAMTILKMAAYDYDNDTDISYLASTSTLTVFRDTELHIASSTTFAPGGDITIQGNASSTVFDGSLHIDDNAVFLGSGTSTYSIAGSFTMDQGATFTSASTTVLMNATTTGKTITTTALQEITFNDLTFSGSGGGWNINGDIRALSGISIVTGTVSGTADITVAGGSLSGDGVLSMGAGTTTVYGTNTLGGATPWTFANLVLGNGSTVGTTTPGGTATTTILGKLTIATAHYLDAGASIWNLTGAGNVFVEGGTFLEDTSTVRYSGTGGSNILSTTYYNLDVKASGGSPTFSGTGLGIIVTNTLTVGGATTTTLTLDTNDPALDVNGSVTIDATGTLIGSGSGSFTVAGNWDNNGVFTGSGGTVTFDSGGTKTIAAGNSPFANVVVNGPGDFTISEHATATSAFTLTNATSFTVASGQVLAVGGTFTNGVGGAATTWTGSTLFLYGNGNYQINASTTSDTYETVRIGGTTQIRMWNSGAAAYDVSASASLYSQDHVNVPGDLYIFGSYVKTSGNDYWSYTTDFDGGALGSPRTANVRIASGGSVLYTGGGLAVIGTSTASTTIGNQGSGTYALRIGGTASTTWSYYQVRDTDVSGLVFSGTPNVTSISQGDFLVSTASGTAITVGGSVITQNPAKTFTGNIFATSSPIIARNVTATGTTASTWRFANHAGNIAGEAFDSDPAGDPGYIVWGDSAAAITVSGKVYTNEGSGVSGVCDDSTPRVMLVITGPTATSTPCSSSDGSYSISGINYSAGNSIVVYISGASEKAATVTVDPVSNISDMDLYENRVIVRHEGPTPISILDMVFWDSSDDADVPFTAVAGSPDTLTLPANRKLIVWTGKEFEPQGNVTVTGGGAGAAYDGTVELYQNAVFDATGAESHTVGGSLIMGTGATIDDETSTFTFTTTGAGRTIDTNENPLYNVVFNGAGSWTVTNTAFTVANDLAVSQGTVTLPSGTTTVTGSLSVTAGAFNANGGTMLFNSAGAETINPGGSSFGALTINGAGSFTLQGTNATATADILIENGTLTSVSGTLAIGDDFINDGAFIHNSGTLRFSSSSAVTVTASSSDLGGVTFAGAGTHSFTDTNLALLGSLRIEAGSVLLPAGITSIAGSFVNAGGSFNNASGTILFNSSDTGETVNPGSSPFYNVSFSAAGGGWTISGNATTTGNFSLTAGTSFTQASGTRLYVGGVFTNTVGGAPTTWTGSTLVVNTGAGYTINTKTLGGDTYGNLIVGSSTALRMWDSTALTITMGDTSSSLYSQDHAGVSGNLYIFGNYVRTSGADYWSYATDFDGTALGGSSRQAFVYSAEGASTTVTGGSLNIVGTGSFDTTISNQGSGTYGMNILGGTLNAQYYSFANMGAEGLYISGETTVTSLTEGNFTLAVSGGSLITIASTTVNYNAGLTISGVSLATTSAITGYNVNLVGTTPSAWTFTGHSGNFDGEAFDNDGGDACGSIRWDDSSCLLTEQTGYRWRADDGGEGVPNSEWYNLSWSKRKRVTVTNLDAVTYTNAVVEISIPYDSDMQADFDDLRFTQSDGTTLTNHFTESYTASTQAVVWVKVPTLATSTTAELYMYYGNGAVSDGSATTTFIAMDNFEDGNITEYSGETSQFTVGGSGAFERTYRLEASDPANSKTTQVMRNTNVTVQQGQTLRYLAYIDATGGSGDEICTHFGVQSGTASYAVCLELFGVDRLSISKDAVNRDTSGTVLSSTTVTYSTGWYEVEVDWRTNDSIFAMLVKDGTTVATTTATSSSYTQGGIGFTVWSYHGGIDIYSARPLLTTEPTTTIGHEQVPGGASWLGVLNTPATGVSDGEKVRLRVLIENTGLDITAQNFLLEYAPKDAAPSCASVNFASYTAVPPVASCGTSEICMESSSNITNLEPTTDLLGGLGTFVPGQVVEDPSNKTGNLDVASGEYIELEYVLSPTVTASDSAYCFRVTNDGTDLDSYAQIGELQLVFEPTIISLSLNGDADITLTGGATTTVYATGTVSDLNGYADLTYATTTVFRSGVGESCTADNNNCYIAGPSQCSFTNCSGTTCDVECSVDIYYHADPTDIGTYAAETWRALLSIADMGGAVATATAPSIDLITLRALSIGSDIDYGTLAVNSDTGSYNATTTITNIGNAAIDIAVEGTDLTDGVSSAIPVSEQLFATSSFTYSACTVCRPLATTSTTTYEIDLPKPTDIAPPITDEIFWGIAVPFGIAGAPHSGINTFYAVGD